MEEQSKVKLCVKLHTGKLCLRKNQSCTINTYGDLSHMTLKLKIEMHYSRCQLVEEKHRCKKCCPLRRFHRGVIGRENTFFFPSSRSKRGRFLRKSWSEREVVGVV